MVSYRNYDRTPTEIGLDNRNKIIGYLRQHPERRFSTREVSEAVGLNCHSVRKHLHALARFQPQNVGLEGKKKHYFYFKGKR